MCGHKQKNSLKADELFINVTVKSNCMAFNMMLDEVGMERHGHELDVFSIWLGAGLCAEIDMMLDDLDTVADKILLVMRGVVGVEWEYEHYEDGGLMWQIKEVHELK